MRSTRYRRRGVSPEMRRWAALLGADNSRELTRLRGKLARALAEEVTPRQRQVLDLYYQEEMNLEEIGLELGVGKSVVSRTLRRGEDKLRRCLRYGSPVLLDVEPAVRGRRRGNEEGKGTS